MAGIGLLFVTLQHAAHRATGTTGEERGHKGVRPGVVLRPEATPHVVLDHPHLRLGNPQRHGHLVTHPEHTLRGFPDGEPVVIPLCHRSVRFHGCVQHALGPVFARDHHRRLGQSTHHIAPRDQGRRPAHHVGGATNQGCIGRSGFLVGKHEGRRLPR